MCDGLSVIGVSVMGVSVMVVSVMVGSVMGVSGICPMCKKKIGDTLRIYNVNVYAEKFIISIQFRTSRDALTITTK